MNIQSISRMTPLPALSTVGRPYRTAPQSAGPAQARQALTATPTATPAPSEIPGNFSGEVTDNGIVLSWTTPKGEADNHIICRMWPRHSRDGTYVRYDVSGSSTSYFESDIAVPGGHYRFNIRGFRGG